MIIKESIYKQILSFCPLVPPETGGIIGTSSTIVDTVAFDNCNKILEAAIYVPNVERLNTVLSNWKEENVSFCGLFHSHKNGQESLSKDDMEYIQTIFSCLPQTITELYFPIVISKSHIISYKAVNQNHSIRIMSDTIDIVP